MNIRKIKKVLLGLILFLIIGGVVILIANEIMKANQFFLIPKSYGEGENAYQRGWRAVGCYAPPLKFVTVNNEPTLQIEPNDVSRCSQSLFEFETSTYVFFEFRVKTTEAYLDNPSISIRLMKGSDIIATFLIPDFNIDYQIKVNHTVGWIGYGMTDFEIPVPAGGFTGLRFDLIGFEGIVQFIGLQGYRLK